MKTGSRLYYLDVLRIFAIFCVVLVHVSGAFFYDAPVSSTRFLSMCLYDEFAHIAVPIFVMISGALFLDPSRDITYGKIFKKYLPRLGVAFAVWSAAYAAYNVGAVSGYPSMAEWLFELLCDFIRGPFHFWFLPMIAGLYLVTPLLRSFTSDRGLRRAFLALGLAFAIVWPCVVNLLELSGGGGSHELALALQNMLNDANFTFALKYSFYFVLGYHLKERVCRRPVTTLLVGFLALFAGGLLVFYQSGLDGKANALFLNNFSLFVFMGSVGFFEFGAGMLGSWRPSDATARVVRWLSDRVFGIYLVHIFVLDAIASLGLTAMSFNSFLAIPVTVVAVFGVSLAVSAIIRAIPRVGRWLT